MAPCWQCVSWLADQAVQVRVLTSPLPHSVKETKAFNSFEKDYCFRIQLRKPEHFPSIELSKMKRMGHWIKISKMERIGYWIKMSRWKELDIVSKSCGFFIILWGRLVSCSFLCLVILCLPSYDFSSNTICPIEKIDPSNCVHWKAAMPFLGLVMVSAAIQ